MRKFVISIFLILVIATSCSRKYYYNYFTKRATEVTLKYDSKARIKSSWDKSASRNFKMNKKMIDSMIVILERSAALHPDSLFIKSHLVFRDGKQVDSALTRDTFYFNKEKIAYIKKNNLYTPTKHFIQRNAE